MPEHKKGIITADIIDSTSIELRDREAVFKVFDSGLKTIAEHYNIQYEWYRGDALQVMTDSVKNSLRIALLIKTWIRSNEKTNKKPYDIRLALGIGLVQLVKDTLAASDGEAFRISGKTLDELKKNKQTFAVLSNDSHAGSLQIESVLLSTLLENTTPMQCKILFYKLLGYKEEDIANTIHLAQSTVNQHSNAGNWNVISKYLDYFEKLYTYE